MKTLSALLFLTLLASCSTTESNLTQVDEVSVQAQSTFSPYKESDDVDSLLKIETETETEKKVQE